MIRVFQSEQYIEKTVGMFRGFKIVPMEKGTYMLNVKLIGVNEYDVAIGDSDVGAITRLENETDSFEKKILSYEKEGAEESTKLAKAQIEVDKTFEYAEDSERIIVLGQFAVTQYGETMNIFLYQQSIFSAERQLK